MSSATRRPDFARVAIHGTAWRYLTFFGGKLMVFISTIVLARLLAKDDFGLVGYAITTISFLDVVSDFGIGAALVYYPDDKRRASTAFWLNLTVRTLLFAASWFLAPLAGIYFRDERVVAVTRALALTFPIDALGDIHGWMLRKRLEFSRTVIPDFLSAVTKGLASIIFAALGFGAWSLVWGQIAGAMASSIVMWFITPWNPSFEFDFGMAKGLLSYGVHIVGVAFLAMLLQNLDYLLVGRYLGAEALGVYTLAYRLPDLVVLQFARILSTVLFPLYTRMRDIPGSLARGFYLTTRYVSLVTLPLGIGLALVAEPFTLVVFTDKWQEAVPVLQSLAIYSMLLSLAYNAGSAYKAEGRPQVLTWLGFVRLVMLFPALWWAVTTAHSIVMVGWMQALVALIGGIINLFAAARLLGLPLRELGDAIFPSVMATAFMVAATLGVLALTASMSPIWQLILGVLAGGIAYIGSLLLFKRSMIVSLVKNLRSSLLRGSDANRANA
ncbi:MAG: lipopolysaccharide biosynthesis protein [Anaerolineaceae bacterium]|nr:MAG: lipopolysaccharide biosynthesis protein [Anaerolineaceae bacterium]